MQPPNSYLQFKLYIYILSLSYIYNIYIYIYIYILSSYIHVTYNVYQLIPTIDRNNARLHAFSVNTSFLSCLPACKQSRKHAFGVHVA